MPRQTRHLHAHAVNRSVCGEKERLHVRSAKGEIGRHFGRLDRADMGAVRRVNPGAAGAGATHEELKVDHNTRFRSCKSLLALLALRQGTVSKPKMRCC